MRRSSARWVTINDFFHFSDRPFEEISPRLDDYATAYLAQAAARRDPSPIAGRADHARLRAALDALAAAHALAVQPGRRGRTEPIDPTSKLARDRPADAARTASSGR